MTRKQFKLMDNIQQLKAIAQDGEFLAEREDDLFFYRLYIINKFFVEEKIQKTEIGNLDQGVFDTGPNILPYLKRNKGTG